MRGGQRADGSNRMLNSESALGITRRRLLAAGGAASVGAIVALQPQLAKAAVAAGASDPAYLRRASYVPLVGQGFRVSWWGGSATLTLAGVADLSARELRGRDDAFALEFAAPASAPLQHETGPLSLSHPRLGGFDLFVAPVDAASGTQGYEAIVNRSVGVTRRSAPKPPAKRPPASRPAIHAHSLVRSATARRTPRGATFELTLSKHVHAKRVHGWLLRDGVTVAAAANRPVHDHRATLRFPAHDRLARGKYNLIVALGAGPDAPLQPVAVRLG
jgi:hypothetical protein